MNNSKYFQIKNLYTSLTNPQKYLSENKVVTARSGWEIQFVKKFLDTHSSIIGWTSEDFCIPYLYPVDNKIHRYFPDFHCKILSKDNVIRELLIEIKPYVETQKPAIPKRINAAYKDRCETYIKNKSKWEAAVNWCKEQTQLGRPTTFQIVTEKDFPFK